MCGIAGFQNFQNKSSDEIVGIAQKMGDAIAHRGPDNYGFWKDNIDSIAFIHRRLSILDLSTAGNQPMHSPSQRYVISYNGEIYNHLEIRQSLEKEFSDIKWLGQSDTETIIIAIELWGIMKSLKVFSGMFAIAVWDKKHKKLFLARDRSGEKPLYYGFQDRVFLFASEIKALKAHPSFSAKINRDALKIFMEQGFIPAPFSIFEGIYKLLPGKVLILNFQLYGKEGFETCEDYWSFENIINKGKKDQFEGSIENAEDKLDYLLNRTISSQMISDVPLGAFLSGGIDSSLIVSLMQNNSMQPINTFTIGFSEGKYNEADHAKEIADYLGTNHNEHYVTASEALDVIPILPKLYDEPFADSSQIPTYLVSKLAKQFVSVSLSGDAGDELFGGYNRHIYSQKWGSALDSTPSSIKRFSASILDLFKPEHLNKFESTISKKIISGIGVNNLSNLFEKISRGLKARDSIALYESFITNWPKDSNLVLEANSSDLNLFSGDGFTLTEMMMINDFLSYLPNDILVKVDRAAMGLSLETRVPFLNEDIISFAYSLPISMKVNNGQGKLILKNLLSRYIPNKLFQRPKQGFAVPIEHWLRGPLIDWAESLLDKSKLDSQGFLDSSAIIQKWDQHKLGKKNWQIDLWNVLMFQAWLEDE